MPKHPAKNHTAPKGPKPKRASAPARCPGTKGRPGREAFLPVSRADMEARGWDRCDFVYVCGDAYVDHPSFGMAIISRVLEHAGYRVGVICQPDWTDPASIAALGEPRLGFLISAGNMDSMVNHYTVNKKPRHEDAYTPGGRAGARPNRAVTVYGNLIRRTFKDKPIIIGGIEASLRRLAHYDYWQDKLKRSVLLDSGADILLYGMGEHSIVEVADALDGGLPVDQITFVNGSVYRTSGAGALDNVFDYELLPSWDELEKDRLAYARSFNIQQQNMDPITGGRLVEPYPNGVYVVQNPPSVPLTEREMDEVAELPYARHWHPDYDAAGGIPAFDEIRFSISSNRGCFGECSFCALAFHQGRMVQVRSRESIMREAEVLTHDPEFKGHINDVGGPTANFFKPACKKQLTHGVCENRRCLWPNVCRNMDTNEDAYAELLRDLRQIPGVKKVFVRSGIRFDYTMADASDKFLVELLQHHVSGQLRLAPEHVSDAVLSVMGKPRREVYDAFVERFERLSAEYGLKQYVVPYLISSHPGSTMKEAVELREKYAAIKENEQRWQDESIEDADYVFVAYGVPGRATLGAVRELRADYLLAYAGWRYGIACAAALAAAVAGALAWLWRTALRTRSGIGRLCAVGCCALLTMHGVLNLLSCLGWSSARGMLPFLDGGWTGVMQAGLAGLLLSAFRLDDVLREPQGTCAPKAPARLVPAGRFAYSDGTLHIRLR